MAPDAISQTLFAMREMVIRFLAESGLTHGDDYVIAMPFQERVAEYERADVPVITIHIEGVPLDQAQPNRWTEMPVNLDFDITVSRRLIDPISAGIQWLTYYWLWSMTTFLAGRMHRAQVPITTMAPAGSDEDTHVRHTYTRISIIDIGVDVREVQENEGVEAFVILGTVPTIIQARQTLLNFHEFVRFVAQPAPATEKLTDPVGGRTTETGGVGTIALEPIDPVDPDITPRPPWNPDPFADDEGVQEILRRSPTW